jgi:hypothetical protein
MTNREESIAWPIAREPGLKRTVRAVWPTGARRKMKRCIARDVAMRVKLCARCPHVPQDMAGYYDLCATLHLCTRCDDAAAIPAIYQRREVQRFEPATDRGGNGENDVRSIRTF